MPLARAFPETQHTREEELLWQDGREYELSGLTLSADGSADAVPVGGPAPGQRDRGAGACCALPAGDVALTASCRFPSRVLQM